MPVIFDFDGVISDSREVVLEVVNLIAQERHQPPLTGPELAALDPQSLRRAWRLRFWQVPALVRQARAMMAARWERLRLCPQIAPVLHWASAQGLPQAIVSSNATDVVTDFTQQHLAWVSFYARIGEVPLWRKHQALARLVRRAGWRADATYYIGDEARDMVAARRAGIIGVGVTWGKDDAATLTGAGAAVVATTPEALIEALGAGRIGAAAAPHPTGRGSPGPPGRSPPAAPPAPAPPRSGP